MANEITKIASEVPQITDENAVSWAPQVIADSSGSWSSNSLRFATKAEALASADNLMMRWMAVRDHRAAPSADAVNSRWDAVECCAVTVEAPVAPVAEPEKTPRETFLLTLAEPLTRRGEGSSSVKDVVGRIRLEIKAAIASGVVPVGTKLSITSDHNSVRVEFKAWPGQVLNDEYATYLMDEYAGKREALRTGIPYVEKAFHHPPGWRDHHDRMYPALTHALIDAITLINHLADRHNYDESDYMSDYVRVGYYLTVNASDLQALAERGLRLEWDPAFAEKARLAGEAAKRLGPKVTASLCGAIDEASEYGMDRLLKLDAYAKGRPLTYCARSRGWRVSADVMPSHKAMRRAGEAAREAREAREEGEWEAANS